MSKRAIALAAACLATTLTACGYRPSPLTQQEKQIVNELTASLKTRCVGRYLIDVPEDSREYGYAETLGIDITTAPMTKEAYQQEIAQQEALLKATKSIDAYPFLYEAGTARGENTYYFVHRGFVQSNPSQRHIEGYKWDRGYRFLLKVEAYDYTDPDQTDGPIVRRMAIKNSFPKHIRHVFFLLENLRGRAKEEIPAGPGLCFPGGFLPGPAAEDQYVRGNFTLTRNRDVSFELHFNSEPQGNVSLLQHADSAEVRWGLKQMDANVIRKGAVDLAGIKAEEWLFEGLKPGDGRGVTFALHINSTTSSPSSPYFSLNMRTGGKMKIDGDVIGLKEGSLSVDQAVELWDAVSRTVRIGPNAL